MADSADNNHWFLDKEEYNKDDFTEEEAETHYRQWGYYKVLHEGDGYTVKELTILPGKSLSDQRHFKRAEHWFVLQGELWVDLEYAKTKKSIYRSAGAHKNTLFITKRTWHRPYNAGNKDTIIIETWVGDSTEEDIERRNII